MTLNNDLQHEVNNIMTYKISARYGETNSVHKDPHTGIDFVMKKGTELKSINDGKIIDIVDYGNANIGKGVMVQWEDGKIAIYGHLSKINPNLSEGEHISKGELLGYSGNTGNSTGSHLHFGLKEDGQFIDPSPYIDNIQNMNNQSYIAHSKFEFGDFMQQQAEIFNKVMESLDVNLIIFYFNKMLYMVIGALQHFI